MAVPTRQSVSVIIVSYNDREILRRCLDALGAQLAADDEIIVVDNGSTDGVLEDLRARAASGAAGDQSGGDGSARPLKLIENGENAGFPVGCNIGFAAAAQGNDIFLLNNDAVLADNALEALREALYAADDIGAVGAVSNNALEQIEPDAPQDMEEALSFGAENGRMWKRRMAEGADGAPYEYRPRLTGFAVLLKRTVVDQLVAADGYFLDPRFSPGYFEDEDLGMRVARAGFRQTLCHNAFVYHKGGTGFAAHPEAMTRGRERFLEKWGFDAWAYIGVLDDHEGAVRAYLRERRGDGMPEEMSSADVSLRILELDCGMGVNLAHLQYLYPKCKVLGMERDPLIAGIAAQLIDVICGSPEEALRNAEVNGTPEAAVLPAGAFDLIFVWDACARSAAPEKLRAQLKRLLKTDGRMVET